MAVKNIRLGGADEFENKKPINAEDLNDTFDAAVDKVQTLTTFWLNDFLYDVYDDFESYSVGEFTSNAKWDFTTTVNAGSGLTLSGDIQSSNPWLEGTTKSILLTCNTGSAAGNGTVVLESKTIPNDRHIFAKYSYDSFNEFSGASLSLFFQLGNISEYTIYSGGTGSRGKSGWLFCRAKGAGFYDVYIDGLLIINNLETTSDNNFRITLNALSNSSNTGTSSFRLDDVRVSKHEVE